MSQSTVTSQGRRSARALATLVGLVLAGGTLGCIVVHPHHDEPEVVVVEKRQGPPHRAPAHGWRRKHADAELVYRSDLGAYVVVGWEDHYFCDDLYYRFDDAHWWRSPQLRGPWLVVDARHVPRGLTKVAYHRPKQKHR